MNRERRKEEISASLKLLAATYVQTVRQLERQMEETLATLCRELELEDAGWLDSVLAVDADVAPPSSAFRPVIEQNATISASLIDSADGLPSSAAYRTRFGSLVEAYRLAGHAPNRDYGYVEINRQLRSLRPRYLDDLVDRLGTVGATVSHDLGSGFLMINGEYSASVVLSRCRETAAGSLRWYVRIDQRLAPDITILVRMDPSNQETSDFYFLPIMDIESPTLLLCESNGAFLDTYRFDSLDYFTQLAAREELEVAA